MYLCFLLFVSIWFMCFGDGVLILKMRGVGGAGYYQKLALLAQDKYG